jgi:hypothetical protein
VGDPCDVTITQPLDGGIVDCGDPRNVRTTVAWDPGDYDRFQVVIAWDPSFATGTFVTSGDFLSKTSYTLGAKKQRRVCREALAANPGAPALIFRIRARDAHRPRTDPDRTTLSPDVATMVVP